MLRRACSVPQHLPEIDLQSGGNPQQRVDARAAFEFLNKKDRHHGKTRALRRDDFGQTKALSSLFKQTSEFTFDSLLVGDLGHGANRIEIFS